MAPLRRYLRITRYSVLEVRIYLDRPSDTPWLLRDQVLPRIFKEIRPKVLPKLREENENSRKKGSKKRKKGIKDVVSQDDFEVTIFLIDSVTRHSLITKQKQFAKKPPIKSTGTKLTGWLGDNVIDVDDEEAVPGLLREESDETSKLNDIPQARLSKRRKMRADEDAYSISSNDQEDAAQTYEEDDKKKLGLNTSYDGFSLYGKILCLIVKRKGNKIPTVSAEAPVGGSEMMESWVSTQINQQADLDDDG